MREVRTKRNLLYGSRISLPHQCDEATEGHCASGLCLWLSILQDRWDFFSGTPEHLEPTGAEVGAALSLLFPQESWDVPV